MLEQRWILTCKRQGILCTNKLISLSQDPCSLRIWKSIGGNEGSSGYRVVGVYRNSLLNAFTGNKDWDVRKEEIYNKIVSWESKVCLHLCSIVQVQVWYGQQVVFETKYGKMLIIAFLWSVLPSEYDRVEIVCEVKS